MYRAFLIGATDRVFGVRVLNSANDAAALRLASKLQAPCHMIEVWESIRKLGVIFPRNLVPQAFRR